MEVIRATKLIFVDIDETLVVWEGTTYKPHEKHVEYVKRFAARGHSLIAWSAGGAEWAALAVRDCGLESYFLYAMGKPDWFMDDKSSIEFMPEANRVYFPLTPIKDSVTISISPIHIQLV